VWPIVEGEKTVEVEDRGTLRISLGKFRKGDMEEIRTDDVGAWSCSIVPSELTEKFIADNAKPNVEVPDPIE
jgi:hypothetical protein